MEGILVAMAACLKILIVTAFGLSGIFRIDHD
jgi:hypothetical protein